MKKLFLIAALLVLPLTTSSAQSAEELLQQALRLERSEGDYSGAIDLYRQVADSPATDRLLVGQALVQMARAYENMGRSEAARTYQRVLSEFADVPALASEAREGFARTRQAPAVSSVEPGSRDIIDTGSGFSLIGGGISPGGRYLFAPYYDPLGITFFDTSTGEQTIIPVDRGSGHAEYVRFSPDETMFATAWRGYEPAGEELLLFDVATQDYEVLLDATVYLEEQGIELEELYAWGVWPFDWTNDGSGVLAFVNARKEDGSLLLAEFLIVPRDGSAPRKIAGPEVAHDFSWWAACLSSEDRFLFLEAEDNAGTMVGDVPGSRKYVRRVDVSTGEVSAWRQSGTGDVRLVGCIRDDRVLYATGGFGSLALRSASADDLLATDDPALARIDDQNRFGAISDAGDLPISRDDGDMMLLLFDVADEGLGSRKANLADRFVSGLAWGPDGESLAWTQAGVPGAIRVLLPGQDEPRIYEVPGLNFGAALRWDSPNYISVRLRPDAEAPELLAVLDLETGVVRRVPESGGEDLLLLSKTGTNTFLSWSRERSCFEFYDVETAISEVIHCGPDPYVSDWFDLSPDGTQAVNFGRFEDGSGEAVVVALDGSGDVRRFPLEAREGGVARSRWATPTEAVISWGGFNHDSLAFLNLETGELRPFFPEILQEVRPNKVELSPDGRRLAVFAYPKEIDGRKTTIIRNLADLD